MRMHFWRRSIRSPCWLVDQRLAACFRCGLGRVVAAHMPVVAAINVTAAPRRRPCCMVVDFIPQMKERVDMRLPIASAASARQCHCQPALLLLLELVDAKLYCSCGAIDTNKRSGIVACLSSIVNRNSTTRDVSTLEPRKRRQMRWTRCGSPVGRERRGRTFHVMELDNAAQVAMQNPCFH